MNQIPVSIKKKLESIAETQGKSFQEVREEHKNALEKVDEYKDLTEEQKPYAALRSLLGNLDMDQRTEILMPRSTPVLIR